jgi:hypothetical protein
VDDAAVAYAWAHDEAHLNFLDLTEHNHLTTQSGLDGDQAAAEAVMSTNFIALVGQEFSTLPPDGGNHVGLHNVITRVPTEKDNDYRFVFHEFLPKYTNDHPQAIVVCQFNHPDDPNRDYGAAAIGGFPNFQGDPNTFVAELDPWVRLIAIISGPADSNMKKSDTPPRDTHQDSTARYVSAWQTYIDRGFHLSPVADQDNHRHSWGTRTTARTGVWLDEPLTRDSLLRGLKAGRCFATEDKDLSVWFELNGKPMGSIVPDPGSGALTFLVTVRDLSEPGSHYQVELFGDKIRDGKLASRVGPVQHAAVGQSLSFTVQHVEGVHEAYFVHVKQEDTPSDQDDAWTAPIWIDPALAGEASHHLADLEIPANTMFVGSKKGSVYHLPDCSLIKTIARENLVLYTNAPPGKRLHKGCPSN